MQNFSVERKIPASEVTLDLLKQLERVLLNDIAPQPMPSNEAVEPEYSIAITDSFGTERLKAIADYRPLLLPNTTSSILVRFQSPYGSFPRVRVTIQFDIKRLHSEFTIDVTDDSARNVALGLEARLQQILAPQRRLHGFLHPNVYVEAIAWAIASTSLARIIHQPKN